MTRAEALKLFEMSADDFADSNIKDVINSKFRALVKQVHPDTSSVESRVSVAQIKDARNVLIEFITAHNMESDFSDDVCPKCLGQGFIKVMKGFTIVNEICGCMHIKRK